MNLRVAFYLPSLQGGGAERAMVTLANGFAARGLEVDLVLASAEGPYLTEVEPAVRVVDLKARRVLASLPGLVRYLRGERPHALLSALNHANVIAVFARLLAREPVRLIVSERTNTDLSNLNAKSLKERIIIPFMRLAYLKADGVIAVSRGSADILARAIGLPRKRISVGYNPVVTPELIQKSQAPLEHPWLGVGKPPVVLGVGRLTPAKDFPTLLRAFAKVRAERECRLVILGEGELRQELEALIMSLGIQESVLLPGFADNPFAWMSRVDLFVLSSAWEGLPNALIQAMACGAPIISTDCPSGPSEILEEGKWGTLVAVGNAEAMASAIRKQLFETDSKIDSRARAEFYSIDAAVEAYLDVLIS